MALSGHCPCGETRYELDRSPLYTHCCHCTYCQRETGSAFAVNLLVEADAVKCPSGQISSDVVTSASGNGQTLCRCKACKTTLWSFYNGLGQHIAFVRGGTLETPSVFPPDIHIFCSTKLPWVNFTNKTPQVPNYYSRREYWPKESLERFEILTGRK